MSRATEDIKEKARRALEKPASIGPDVDLERYRDEAGERLPVEDLSKLPEPQRQRMTKAGIDVTERQRAGSLIVMDHSVVHRRQNIQDLEILDIRQALQSYPDIRDFWWKAVPVDADKFTATAELDLDTGYFIRARAGARSIFPLQACLFIGQDGLAQKVHNLIIAEEGSELHIITGCAVDLNVRTALHVGITEIYVQKGATVTFTMIHNWGENVEVRPRTSIVVEEGGTFISNYVLMEPVQTIQTYPTAYLVGKGAVARFSSVIVGLPGSHIDVGSRVVLQAPETRAEIISRSISAGGRIIARGHLLGEAPRVKAHLECRGLMLRDDGVISAIPELSTRFADVDMSHEAAVGRIAQEEIEYLMARGISKDDAVAIIVRGFLNVKVEGLPAELQADLDRVIQTADLSGL